MHHAKPSYHNQCSGSSARLCPGFGAYKGEVIGLRTKVVQEMFQRNDGNEAN